MDDSIEQLAGAVAALEAQRPLLGDATVDVALGPMRERLAMLRSQARSRDPQLKAVSVLFVDIVGSTAMTRELDPEDVHAIFDGALARFSAIVAARNGRVLQYAGDSMLAAFGADEAHEDDAENAVRCGLAILGESARIAAEVEAGHGLPGFAVRAGINTGPVLLGGGVDDEGSIRGITVNVAARMEQSAPEGGLRITHDTYRLVRGVFDVSEQPSVTVKGIDAPLRSYLVHRAKPRAFRLANRGVEGVECRMVGRDQEQKRLTDAFEDAVADRALTLISIVGDAGLGKSRLLSEFGNWLDLQPHAVWCLQGRAELHGQMLPYGVVRELFCWRFEIEDSDALPDARRKLVDALRPLLGDAADEQAALLGHLIGLDFGSSPFIAGIAGDPKQIRDRAFNAAARYLKALAADGPILIQLEDLHWADEGSLDFINHLAQGCRDLPVLVLCAMRPSLFERRPLWGSGQGNHERIDLGPLTRRCSRELACALLQRIPSPPTVLRELLTNGAEGNPFYMEELTRMLVDDGVIVTGDGDWHVLPERLARVHVPPTLTGVLQARLDALPADEKAALQCAAVIGHVFWDAAMAAIEPGTVDALDAPMARGLIHGRETTQFEAAREFVFEHQILRQVTYECVLKRHRREGHRRVAEWLVRQGGDRIADHYALIGDHFDKAGDAVDAARYLTLAAHGASKAYANDAAVEHFGRALALTPESDGAARFDLLSARGVVYAHTGQRAPQLADATALLEIAERLDDDAKRAIAYGALARHAFAVADYRRAVEHGATGLACAERAGDPVSGLDAHSCWLNGLRMMGDHREAVTQAERLLAVTRALDDQAAYLRVVSGLGGLAVDRGNYGAALAHFRKALECSRALGDRINEAGALGSIGDLERCLGNYDRAIDRAREAVRIYAEVGFVNYETLTQLNIATAMRLRGDLDDALAASLRGLEMARQSENPDLVAAGAQVAGDAHRAIGRLDDADRFYGEALALYRAVGREMMAMECLAGSARVAEARGALDRAAAHVHAIVAFVDAGGTVDGTEDAVAIYLTCHDVLDATGSPRAAEFLGEGHALLTRRAGLLGDGERATFLGSVRSHRALLDAVESRQRAADPVETA